MTKINFSVAVSAIFSMILSCVSAVALAQDSSVTTTTTTSMSNESAVQPWVYILGGIVVLGIIIAVTSGRKKTMEAPETSNGRTVSKNQGNAPLF